MTSTTLSSAVTALSVAALTVGLAGPASADSIGVRDPRDTSHGSDLRAVHVEHGDRDLVVTTHHTNLRRDPASGSAGTVYVDTDPGDRGPEIVLVGGYFVGTDYQLLHTEGFGRRRWGTPVDGSYEMTVDYAKDQVRPRSPRSPARGSRRLAGSPPPRRAPRASRSSWLRTRRASRRPCFQRRSRGRSRSRRCPWGSCTG